ncbi:MAG: SAM-dependent methyltransferase, partial [Hyphomonadaceae bacterium]
MLFGLYERFVLPRFIDCACGAKPIAKQRAKLIPRAYGVVVDMGFGSGTNLPFLDASKIEKVIAVEPSASMLAWKREDWRTDVIVEEVVAG